MIAQSIVERFMFKSQSRITAEPQSKHVYVIDDDMSVRNALVQCLGMLRYDVHQFTGAEDFLENAIAFRPAVLVIDMQMPKISGIQLQAQLSDKGWDCPVIFVSGESTVQQSIMAMKQGALDFLVKPFEFDHLATLIDAGIERDKRHLQNIALKEHHSNQLKVLKPRELEAFYLLAKGDSYSELMQAMDISKPTAKQYRAAVMRKLNFPTLAALISFHEEMILGT